MNKKIRALLISMALVLSLLMVGCGGKSVSAEEYVTGIYKLFINMDSEAAKTFGMSDNDIKTYKEAMEKSVKETMTSMNESFKQQFGLYVDENLMSETGQEYLNALKRLTVTTSEESKTEKEVKVKVSTTVLDMPALTTEAMTKAEAKIKASDYTTTDEYFKALIPAYVICLKDDLASYTPSGDPATITVTVTKDGNKWSTDLSELTKSLSDAAVKKY